MECESPPEWLNSEFLMCCLRGKEKGLIGDVSFTVEPAVAAGNNFMCSVVRVNVKYCAEGETKTISLIIKYISEGKEAKEINGILQKRENRFYDLILPGIRKCYSLKISPEIYPSPIPSILVMEDLKASGYEMKDRKALLDFEHCKFFIEALGKLHASALIASKKNTTLVEALGPNMFFVLQDIKGEKEKEFWKFGVQAAINCFSRTIENDVEYKEEHDVIKAVTESLIDLIISFVKLPNTFKTIIHGDCWTTNVMFKYDEFGKITSVKTFDFQNCSFSPAVMDLVYFIWLSSSNGVRENRLEDLYHLYCDTLNYTLRQLGSDVTLTYSKLKEEITLASPLILYCVAFRLPAHLFDGVFTLDELQNQVSSERTNPGINFHHGKSYGKVFPHILKQMNREGVFDHLKKLL